MRHTINVLSSTLASTAGGWRGTNVRRAAHAQPARALELYEFEACPYCRVVRYALTELDLDALILPCPKGGARFRPTVRERGGRAQFPYLVDPNTDTALFESADIVDYLARTYTDGEIPAGLARRLRRGLTQAVSLLSSSVRPLRGMRARPSRTPDQPLELYSFESSPYSRLVREVLCELELPYLLHSTGKARPSDLGPPWVRDRLLKAPQATSRSRAQLLSNAGHVQVPYLIDPNTETALFESADIIDYLNRTYAL